MQIAKNIKQLAEFDRISKGKANKAFKTNTFTLNTR